MNEQAFSTYFKAFGDPTRLKILSLLSSGSRTVGQITAAVGLSQPTISRHLAVLRSAGVVNDRREGQQVFYTLNLFAVKDCCKGFCNCLTVNTKAPRKRKKR